MKFATLLALALTSSFASASVTKGLTKIIEPGTYVGKDCTVTVTHNPNDSVYVQVTERTQADGFTVLNNLNSRGYVVSYNEAEKSVSGSINLNYPRYINGGTKSMYVKDRDGKVSVSISTVLFDHRGNDMGTMVSCIVSK